MIWFSHYYYVTSILVLRTVISEDIEYYASESVLNSRKSKILEHASKKEKSFGVPFKYGKRESFIAEDLGNKSIARNRNTMKRSTDSTFHGYPKSREELWNEHFLNETTAFDQTPSLIKLLHNITLTYLNNCIPVILYDNLVKNKESYLFQNLLKAFPVTYIHGHVNDDNKLIEPKLLKLKTKCLHYIIFVTDVKRSAKILGKQSHSKVVIVARSSQWAVEEFLAGPLARIFINLLVIGQSIKEKDDNTLEAPYIMYTHKLYTDGLGASKPVILNSWVHGKFSRNVNLFPLKMTEGYAGHRFIVAASHQPPFVFRRIKTDLDGGNPRVEWDGIELRILYLLAERNNFSIEIIEPRDSDLGAGDAVAKEISLGRADIGIAGIYLTGERIRDMDMSFAHSRDCAVFITLMSTALPRYRAILGPFHWHVWVALIFTYLFGMFPLAFSDKHTLRHLIHNSGEIENMFWYVFGTFTNSFTFLGRNSWSKTTKITTRLLIGWYWIFTIIITSCYTGSIIAFVTLPLFPETVDSIDQLLAGFYRIGTLDRGGWERWFLDSSDPRINKLFRKIELVPDVAAGIRNTTKAFFWPYAFLGSQAELEYIVQANFTKTKSKRAVLHISNECFVPFGVVIGFPNNSLYSTKLSEDISRMLQSGLIDKISNDVRWEMQRSSTGGHLAVQVGTLKMTPVEEKGLTLEDTQGMFLLLAAGFLMGATALLSEWMGGFTRRCRFKKKVPPKCGFEEELEGSEKDLDMISKDTDIKQDFSTRSSTAGSKDTLDGNIINVTNENIIIHDNLQADQWPSGRSSSVDLDREVKEIFERDEKRRSMFSNNPFCKSDDTESNASTRAFGKRIK